MVPSLVDQAEWIGVHVLGPEAAKRMWHLDAELQAAQIALTDFHVARLGTTRNAGREAWARLAYSTKGFITAVHRFGRMLESMQANGRDFPPYTREQIGATWKRAKAFLESYGDARNSVEHIHGDVAENSHFMNYFESPGGGVTATVVPGSSAEVSDEALEKLVAYRGEILSGMQIDYLGAISEARMLSASRAAFLWALLDRATV